MPKERITIADNETFAMWYYPESKIVHHEIKKYIYGQRFREMLMLGYEQFVKRGATKWLSDDRKNNVLCKADEDWGRVNWYPITVKAGWKYWAIVLPAKAMGHDNMTRLGEEYSRDGVTTRYFTDPDEALAWLEKQG